jgi:hypothetical protein
MGCATTDLISVALGRRYSIDVLPNHCGDLCRMAAGEKVTPALDRDEMRRWYRIV